MLFESKKKRQERLAAEEAAKKARKEAEKKAKEEAERKAREDADFIERLRQNPVMQELVECALKYVAEDVLSIARPNTVREIKKEWKLFVCSEWCRFYHGGVMWGKGYYHSEEIWEKNQKTISFSQQRLPNLTTNQMVCFVKAFERDFMGRIGAVLDNFHLPDSQQNFSSIDCEAGNGDEQGLVYCCRRYTYTAINNNYVEVGSW